MPVLFSKTNYQSMYLLFLLLSHQRSCCSCCCCCLVGGRRADGLSTSHCVPSRDATLLTLKIAHSECCGQRLPAARAIRRPTGILLYMPPDTNKASSKVEPTALSRPVAEFRYQSAVWPNHSCRDGSGNTKECGPVPVPFAYHVIQIVGNVRVC